MYTLEPYTLVCTQLQAYPSPPPTLHSLPPHSPGTGNLELSPPKFNCPFIMIVPSLPEEDEVDEEGLLTLETGRRGGREDGGGG